MKLDPTLNFQLALGNATSLVTRYSAMVSKGLEFRKREHAFWRLCSIDLQTAGQILGLIKRYRGQDSHYPLILSFIVSYARPYSTNAGIGRSHQLGEKGIVPSKLRDLHEDLIALRNRQVAHIDVPLRNPKLSNFGTSDQPFFLMSFRGEHLEIFDTRFAEIEELVRSVETNLNDRVKLLELEIAAEGGSTSPGSGPLTFT